jgi:hypothetical protein
MCVPSGHDKTTLLYFLHLFYKDYVCFVFIIDFFIHSFVHSLIPLTCAECNNSLPFSGASSIPLCYMLLPATLLHQLFFHPPLLNLVTYFLVYLFVLLIPNSYIILFWEFCFLPFSEHVQTNTILFPSIL